MKTINHGNITTIVVDSTRAIEIDHFNRTIALYAHEVGRMVRIYHNKDMALKLNKQSISTCDMYMLEEYLTRTPDAVRALYSRFNYNQDIEHEKTIAGMLSGMDIDTFTAWFESLNLSVRTAKSAALKRVLLRYLMCDDHTGKMAGMISISTYVKYNRYCLARRANCPGGICGHCFAYDQTGKYIDQAEKLKKAHVMLTTVRLYPEDVPHIDVDKYPFFRFESFGDLANVLQFENYTVIAAALDQHVTLWTKNPGIIRAAVNNGATIPDNMRIILSSLVVNRPLTMEYITHNGFDKFASAVFTVYSSEDAAAKNGVTINCGARHCLTCARCYNLPKAGAGLVWINELLK